MICVNGRFVGRPVTGVERYASEIVPRLGGQVQVIQPGPGARGGVRGHLWEQTILPTRVPDKAVLWSPCNWGPIALARQAVTIHDVSALDHPGWFSPRYVQLQRQLLPRLVRRASCLITVSTFTKERLAHHFGVEPEKVVVAHNGVSSTFGQECGADRPCELPATVGADDRPYLLAVGSIEPRKNLRQLLSAYQLLRRSLPDSRLVVAGSVGASQVFSRVGELDGDGVEFVGRVTDRQLACLYRHAAALVYVPLYEGFGIPPVEAMASGCRVVASDIPPLREVCGPLASYVDASDTDALVAALRRMLESPAADSDRAALMTRARSFSWDRSAEQIKAALLGLLEAV